MAIGQRARRRARRRARWLWLVPVILWSLAGSGARAEERIVRMYLLTPHGVGLEIGTVHVRDHKGGLYLAPSMKELPPGSYRFAIHEHGDCGTAGEDGQSAPGLAAGAVYVSAKTKARGDLPNLTVGPDGIARASVVKSGFKVADLDNRSLVVAGRNGRIACGVIPP